MSSMIVIEPSRKEDPIKRNIKGCNENNNKMNDKHRYEDGNNNNYTDSLDSGFPFDDGDFVERDHSLTSQLDDLAKRHPELAEHLNFGGTFPRRSGAGSATSSAGQQRRRRRRPSFEDFGFPFDRYFPNDESVDPEEFVYSHPNYYQQHHQQQPEKQNVPPQESNEQIPTRQFDNVAANQQEHQRQPFQHQPSTSTVTQGTQTELADNNSLADQEVAEGETKKQQRPIQQSNTVDLGQKQEPVEEDRTQRSMSAPPENHPQPRFVSSINIPISRDPGETGGPLPTAAECGANSMGNRTSQPYQQDEGTQYQQQPSHHQSKPTERVIPIHVEGRDEPVMPKNVKPTFNAPPPPPQHHQQQQHFFNQKPSGMGAGSPFGHQSFQRNQGKPSFQQHYQQAPPPPQQQHYQQTPPPPQQHQQAAPPPPPQQEQRQTPPPQQQHQQEPVKPKTALETIQIIQKDVNDLLTEVEKFAGKPKDKQYLYLDEMLTRNLIKLDNVDTEGKDNIRQARREAIKSIQNCLSLLDTRANANQAKDNNQTVDESTAVVPYDDQTATEQGDRSNNAEQKEEGESQPKQNEGVVEQKVEEQPEEETGAVATGEQTSSSSTTNEPMTLEISGVVKTGNVVEQSPASNNDTVEGDQTKLIAPMEGVEMTSEEKASGGDDATKTNVAQEGNTTPMEVAKTDDNTATASEESSQKKGEGETGGGIKKEKKKGKKKEKQQTTEKN